MRIAVDAMGGDHAPQVIIDGVVQAAREFPHIQEIILVGPLEVMEKELARHGGAPPNVRLHAASEVVGMDESPVMAIRKKKDSSIVRAIELVKQGDADAMFSAGNTGAVVATATLKLRTLEGIDRPAIATVFPTPATPFVLLDAGGNTDCSPEMLFQFAVMGDVYAREILGVPSPRVGLLSIGEEDAKGNDTTKEAFKLMNASKLNFIGNVESRDLFEGRVDVVACDGFVGNVVLKTSESVAKAMGSWLKQKFTSSLFRKLGALMLSGALRELKETASPESFGGAPLLGARGVVIIGHGSSTAWAVRNAIRVSAESIQHDINHLIVENARVPAV